MTRAACLSCRALAAFAVITTVLSVLPAGAADLGVRGATWPVAEPDLLEQIETRLAAMQRSGEMARIEREARSRAQWRLEQPEPVPGIAPAREARRRLFDPAIVVERDIRLPDGTLIAAAGSRVTAVRLEAVIVARYARIRRRRVPGELHLRVAGRRGHEIGRRGRARGHGRRHRPVLRGRAIAGGAHRAQLERVGRAAGQPRRHRVARLVRAARRAVGDLLPHFGITAVRLEAVLVARYARIRRRRVPGSSGAVLLPHREPGVRPRRRYRHSPPARAPSRHSGTSPAIPTSKTSMIAVSSSGPSNRTVNLARAGCGSEGLILTDLRRIAAFVLV